MRIREVFSVEGFVDNVTDEDVNQSQLVGVPGLGSPVQTVLDPPRTAGIRIGVRF